MLLPVLVVRNTVSKSTNPPGVTSAWPIRNESGDSLGLSCGGASLDTVAVVAGALGWRAAFSTCAVPPRAFSSESIFCCCWPICSCCCAICCCCCATASRSALISSATEAAPACLSAGAPPWASAVPAPSIIRLSALKNFIGLYLSVRSLLCSEGDFYTYPFEQRELNVNGYCSG